MNKYKNILQFMIVLAVLVFIFYLFGLLNIWLDDPA